MLEIEAKRQRERGRHKEEGGRETQREVWRVVYIPLKEPSTGRTLRTNTSITAYE